MARPAAPPPPRPARLGGIVAVLRHRQFRFLWLAQVCSSAAYASVIFAMVVLIESSTRRNIATSLLFLATVVPAVLFAAPAGAVVDHVSKRAILVGTTALRAGALVAVIGSWFTSSWLLLVGTLALTAFAYSTLNQFYGPAEGALIPGLVGDDLLIPANTVISICFLGMQWVGFSLIGPLLNSVAGPSIVIASAIGLLLVSTGLVARLPRDRPMGRPAALTPRAILADVGRDLRAGLAAIRRDPALVKALGYLTLASVTLFMLGTLGPGYVTGVLGRAAGDLGLLLTPSILGGGLGLLLVNTTTHAGNRERMIDRGIAMGGLMTLVLAVTPAALMGRAGTVGDALPPTAGLAVVMVACVILGGSLACVMVPGLTILQERAPEAMRARVLATYSMLSSAAGIVPTLLAGVLGDLLGSVLTLGLIGLLLTLLGALALWRARRARRGSSGR